MAEGIEQAASFARDELALPDGTPFFVGERHEVDPASHIAADDVIEIMAVRLYDEVGEVSYDWPSPTKEQEQDLTNRLQATIREWIADAGQEPRFWAVKNIQQFK